MKEATLCSHVFDPCFDSNSRILILGSFPSLKSREEAFYYAHPQNRFWKVLGCVFNENVGESKNDREAFILSHGLALYDVIEQCLISGSSDASIKEVIPANLAPFFEKAHISRILLNGKTATRYFKKYQKEKEGIEVVSLPSTSPANAACSLEQLVREWKPFLII